ncbi:alpha-amylase family glycosyl hydrolase [Aestuariibaculum sediminum]|uniref:Alpha-glucosidase C-terminal domain-containing protein n=1 Tax=Aestuariibaculum sediminum TaxID=2770637 RepID=A0A8J6QLG2_9FLAO|nr:alpha-amylase family glycosyl hydrolase [Aestuariibaculum sediminum]MBD0833424.1 alpha-glucosidase C-terminal domain-containing protein [Aestuariibaculum sediminum]
MKRIKYIIWVLPVLALFISCKKEKKEPITPEIVEKIVHKLPEINNAVLESSVIYEANIRQYSKEGTFNAFTKDIPQIKQLGVKIIWLMPIFPISETNRKATGGDFAYKIEDEAERAKMLGSYYAVSDYTKINPEFGTIEDFRKLVKTAHDNGIYVILDWVPNHTGWDHVWITDHPDYYTQNEKGEIVDPTNPETGESWGWGDVADLNYDNPEMRREMIEDMSYWVADEGVDGFRCDVASNVPTDFWEQAIPQLRVQKDIFMLAEAWQPELLEGDLFDMAYTWEGHHIMNEIAQGKKNVSDLKHYLEANKTKYASDDILMNFVTNHDENSWNGTVKERMGDASEIMTALSYMLPGMPLIYSGQEYGLDYRLKFFEKDSIPKTKGDTWTLLEQLGQLKNTHPALNGGKEAANLTMVDVENPNILIFEREKGEDKILFIGNLSKEKQEVKLTISGGFSDYQSNENVNLEEGEGLTLAPWEFKILIKK